MGGGAGVWGGGGDGKLNGGGARYFFSTLNGGAFKPYINIVMNILVTPVQFFHDD